MKSQLKFNLNGEQVTQNAPLTIEALLQLYALDKRKIAVEKNLEIVRRSKFAETIIDEGDNIEIIHFIGGG
jgi:thiamine biosynthesis protein ThiS